MLLILVVYALGATFPWNKIKHWPLFHQPHQPPPPQFSVVLDSIHRLCQVCKDAQTTLSFGSFAAQAELSANQH